MSNPRVGILMGSDSDWPVMKEAADMLDRFDVACEVRVISAHRRPDDCAEYAKSATARGLQVLIGGAGGAAHLAGVLAAHTTLPVIAVPIPTQVAGGLDSLLSMVQMPPGVPVATVGIGRAGNAGLLAVQIAAIGDSALAKRLVDYKQELADKAAGADRKVQEARASGG
ncbi:MAG: 5-(carboxyamino)imidazole ribonucleotide mutase [Acidobacteriota bacterium]